jgi:hypothetical protein
LVRVIPVRRIYPSLSKFHSGNLATGFLLRQR